ncbi:hypothetical protein MF271_04915 [Deinococcus sp. KNUC1210]|uniref:hypothetical protein n=1 Tax=Deinococcus sp. KNUC1210 TaxID=2917691 RepID=UPI001EF110C1|nr:hypothetical protein [Deinococcus sp. KNUC1210]ULH15976.1 hypothetical protein MF271_04915 [Deinococcus sp. KNUC1210]
MKDEIKVAYRRSLTASVEFSTTQEKIGVIDSAKAQASQQQEVIQLLPPLPQVRN